MDKIIGIGELAISNDASVKIKTYALASCVAVTAYCHKTRTGGMVHIALPFPGNNSTENQPGYYATTGVPLLINKLTKEYGCRKNEIVIKLFGGAESINLNDVFNIGKRNLKAVTNLLTELGFGVHSSDVGGNVSRTIEMDIQTGEVKMSTQPISI